MKTHKATCRCCVEDLFCEDTCTAEGISDRAAHDLAVPAVDDDRAWMELGEKHLVWCEWIITRDGRDDRVMRETEECYRALVTAGLAKPFRFQRPRWIYNGCWNGKTIMKFIHTVEDLALEGEKPPRAKGEFLARAEEAIRAKGEIGIRAFAEAIEQFLYLARICDLLSGRISFPEEHSIHFHALYAACELRIRLVPEKLLNERLSIEITHLQVQSYPEPLLKMFQ